MIDLRKTEQTPGSKVELALPARADRRSHESVRASAHEDDRAVMAPQQVGVDLSPPNPIRTRRWRRLELAQLSWWGSECHDCGNATRASLVCDACNSSENTTPMWSAAQETAGQWETESDATDLRGWQPLSLR